MIIFKSLRYLVKKQSVKTKAVRDVRWNLPSTKKISWILLLTMTIKLMLLRLKIRLLGTSMAF